MLSSWEYGPEYGWPIYTTWNFFFFLSELIVDLSIFHCRIMALQYRVGLCHAPARISRKYTHVPLPLEPPSHLPLLPHPSGLGCLRSLVWVPWVIQQTPTSICSYVQPCICIHASLSFCPVAQLVKNPPAMQETPVRFLGQEDLLEKA